MTSAGNIKLGVEIDADNLSAKLGEAVRRAIAPALAQVQRELQKVQREYDQTATKAERSAAKQVASLKAVENQAQSTARALERARAASFGPGGGGPGGGNGGGGNGGRTTNTTNNRSTTNIKNDNRKIDNRKYDRRKVTNNRNDSRTINTIDNSIHYDNRVYNGGGPGGGGGGSGGGGGGGRGGGVLKFLTSPLGLNSISLGAAALPAVATGVTNIVGAVQQLGQAGLALPGIFAGGAAVIGTAVIGFKGLGDAVKALNEADADPKKLEAANEALKNMAPAAQAVAKEVSKLSVGPLREFQKAIAEPLLTGVDTALKDTADKVLPAVQPGMQKVATALNGTIKTALGEVSSDKSLGLVDRILGNTADAQTRADAAIKPLLSGGLQLAKIGSDFLPRIGDAIASVSRRFDAFISKNAANGNLFRWIDEGLNGLRSFGNAILNVGKIITGLTRAAGQAKGSLSGDGGFLGGLERFTDKWSTFVNSPAGQKKLGDFFQGGTGDLGNIADTLRDIWPAIKQVIEGFQTWGRIIAPIIGAIANLVGGLSQVPGLLEAIVVGFLAFRTLGPIIGGLTSKLSGLTNAVGGGGPGGRRGGLVGALGGKANIGLLGATGLLAGSEIQRNAGDSVGSQVGGALTTIGSGALLGGTVGSVIPGVGTAIGAGVGAAAGAALAGYNFLVGQNAEATKKAAEAQDQWAAAMAQSNAARDIQTAGLKAATDALADSGGVIDPNVIASVGDQVNAIPDKLADSQTPETVKKVAEAIGNLKLNTAQLSTITVGAQPGFDALITRLQGMGEPGRLAAEQISAVRDATLGAADKAATAAPLVAQLAEAMGGISNDQAVANIQNAFAAIPSDIPLNIHTAGVDGPGGVLDILKQVGAEIDVNKDGEVHLTAPLAPAVLDQLRALGVQIDANRDGTINVKIPESDIINTLNQLGTLGDAYKQLFAGTPALPSLPAPPVQPQISAGQPFAGFPQPPRRAGGGAIFGGIPGRDSVPILAQRGEFVLDTGDVARMGGISGVEQFRRGLEGGLIRGFEDGGPVDGMPHLGTGALPGPVGPETELSVLVQIRDLLAGKGGASVNPLAATAANTATSAKTAAGAATGGKIGPFGTPLKDRGNLGYKAAAAAISALGGDPLEFIGADPSTLQTAAAVGGIPGVGGTATTGGTVDVAALQKFAASGNTADLPAGLTINSPAVTAILAARNKAKGGLSDTAISDLVGQALSPGGFTGTLDSTNTSLVKALEKLRTKGIPGTAAQPGGFAPTATATGVPLTSLPPGGNAAALVQFAQAANGGKYAAASDLAGGLADCSGAVSDLVEFLTKGTTSPERLFTTLNEGDVLTKLGAVKGLVPGSLQIGVSPTHTAATLPNGVNFESGGSGGGVVYGGKVGAADKQFTETYSLPTDISGMVLPGTAAGLPSGLPGAAGGQGTPVYVTNWPGGGGGLAGLVGGKALSAGIGAAGGAAADVSGDVLGAIGAVGLGTPKTGVDFASLSQLTREGNPMALAKALGIDIPDLTRQGGAAGETTGNDGPGFDASGRLFSDTAGLIDRTFTSLNAQLQAMKEQMVAAIEQTNQKLQDSALTPVVKAGVQSALEGLKDAVSAQIGGALGTAAAPPIADAVAGAVSQLPIDNSGAGGGDLGNPAAIAGALFASGGPVSGGLPGKDSVPAWLMPGEHVLDTGDVARMGGQGGVQAFRNALQRGPIRKFATGGGVIGNDTVGGDFFGVSEVPIIGAIVNTLIRVLLKVIGVDIEVRDTLSEMTDDFRGFRGDAFKAFDAQGRLLNDTSGLIDRTQSSTETAAAERIRILKIVIQAIIKYLIEKVIVPIAKAVANAAIQAGASAAGAATNTGAPGAGGIVSSLISSAGSAGVDIAAEVGTDFALAISSTLIDVVSEGLQSQFPDLATGIFSGGALAGLFDPLSTILGGFLGIFTGLLGGGALGGASTLMGGGLGLDSLFDSGGMARGVGYLPKGTMDDELVLSPIETDMFGRLVGALEAGGFSRGGDKTVHAPITVLGGGPETATQVQNRLIKHLS